MKKPAVSPEQFEVIVDRLEEQALKLLSREARIGSSTRIEQGARVGDVEQDLRLARLRDKMSDDMRKLREHTEKSPTTMDTGADLAHLESAENALKFSRFARMNQAKKFRQLMGLQDALLEAVEVLNQKVTRIGEYMAPGINIELLTPPEIESAFEGRPEAVTLAELRMIDDALRDDLDETMALLQGMTNSVQSGSTKESRKGRYKQQRGAWITCRLIGFAEGLGLRRSRNKSPSPHAPLISAADAVAIVIGRLREKQSNAVNAEPPHPNYLNDPAVKAVLNEMPKDRGRGFDPQNFANSIIRKFVRSDDKLRKQALAIGRKNGEREARDLFEDV